MVMAYARAYHATHDSPKIFGDILADSLFTLEEHTQTDQAWVGLLQYTAPELAATNLQVLELDHPATQTMKRDRVIKAGWNHPSNLHFVPVDFTKESLSAARGSTIVFDNLEADAFI